MHQPRYGRPALALDLMEEFRPLVADSVAISLINRGELGPDDFIHSANGVFLNDRGRRPFWEAWFRRMDTEVSHPEFSYKMAYRRMPRSAGAAVVAVRAWRGLDVSRICHAMSRLRYLVSYDISDPKRLRKVARTLEGFGVRLQYSVFECPLDDLRLAKLKAELQDSLNHEEDQVLFVSLGATSKRCQLDY